MSVCLYQGGYLDFIPFDRATLQRESCLGRISILDDFCYYTNEHKNRFREADKPFEHAALMATFFMQKNRCLQLHDSGWLFGVQPQ